MTIAREHTVGDNKELMKETFREAVRRSDIVVSAGGLGPTFDDLTRETWSIVLKKPLLFRKRIVDEIREKFRSRGIKMPPQNRKQGYLLKGASLLPNHFGTAPGQYLHLGKKVLILLPGPKRELFPMVENDVLPRLALTFPPHVVKEKMFHIVGVPESKIDQSIRPLVARVRKKNGCHIAHGILASEAVITVKFTVTGKNRDIVEETSQWLEIQYKKRVGRYIYGEDDQKLEDVVGQLLFKNRKTLSLAESCTGGLISKLITDVSGSSHYFLEGITTYSNLSKIKNLGVKATTIKKFGAVSAQTAKEMVLGVKKKSKSDYAIAVTGIAGPNGGTDAKSSGLVYIGFVGPKKKFVNKYQFQGNRAWVRQRSALMALELLRKDLLRHG